MQKNLGSEIINFMNMFYEIEKGFSNKVVGLGACSWHSIGQELLRSYKDGDQKTIDFVNNGLLKSYAEKYKDNKPDFADFKNYPEEVLEFNESTHAELYRTYFMFFEGDHNQNSNRLPIFIQNMLEDYSLNKRISDDKKNDKKYMAYKKYIFDPIFNFGDDYLEINIVYNRLFEKIDELCKDKSIELTTGITIMTRINDIISSSSENNLTYTKIVFNFNNNWLLKDQDGYRINPDLLKNSWQSYRIGNILGQAFREYLCDLKKDREQLKKSGSKSDNDNLNKIIDELPDIKKLEKPFIPQTVEGVNNFLSLIAQKTGKSSIVFEFEKRNKNIDKDKDEIDTDKYYLSLIDGKTGAIKYYQIKFIGDSVHVYEKNNPVVRLDDEKFGRRLLGSEVKNLLNQIKEIKATKPFCFIASPGHIENLNHDKENEFFSRIDKVLEFTAANERSKTKDNFCRVGKVFGLFGIFIGFCAMTATVIPIIIFLAFEIHEIVQKKQNKKLSQTQARSDVIECVVRQKVRTQKLKEYIEKTKKVDGNGKENEKTEPNLNLSISNKQDFYLR